MKRPLRPNSERPIARDKFGAAITLHRSSERGYEFSTDGRIYLSPTVALKIAHELEELVKQGVLER